MVLLPVNLSDSSPKQSFITMNSVPYRHNYVGGQWLAARKGGRIPVVNPANEAVIGTIPAGTEEDVQAAVTAALAAFKTWGKTSGAYRAKFLKAIADQVRMAICSLIVPLPSAQPLFPALALCCVLVTVFGRSWCDYFDAYCKNTELTSASR